MADYASSKVEGQRVVLFVCTGGSIRSVFAAGFFNHYNENGLYVAKNAGVKAAGVAQRYVTGAIELMAEKGIKMSGYVPVQLTPGLLEEAWRVYAISMYAAVKLRMNRSVDAKLSVVLDFKSPPSQDIAARRKIRDGLEAMVLGILKELGQ
ncbi:hypothetical protein HYV85_06200 [Candidatus Woesearchaeota archaeon]|nr:hypothetical protein [Candidatus Woesearchaeota archaeon]